MTPPSTSADTAKGGLIAAYGCVSPCCPLDLLRHHSRKRWCLHTVQWGQKSTLSTWFPLAQPRQEMHSYLEEMKVPILSLTLSGAGRGTSNIWMESEGQTPHWPLLVRLDARMQFYSLEFDWSIDQLLSMSFLSCLAALFVVFHLEKADISWTFLLSAPIGLWVAGSPPPSPRYMSQK